MDPTVLAAVVGSGIASIPASLAAYSSYIAARRSGSNGRNPTLTEVRELRKELWNHVNSDNIHNGKPEEPTQ